MLFSEFTPCYTIKSGTLKRCNLRPYASSDLHNTNFLHSLGSMNNIGISHLMSNVAVMLQA